ncbi:hypothetical protein HCN44_004062 [Aphidius gifuensis]|uniref:Leucine-rich repeat-containing protein n=1 Tax=Aphidius gifuensis TaxID=684658 RepID=A0A834XW77_APHGI|nr:protein phosphatase 1 regulatory subunit 42-like [Aphidius gifuensis]KAF7994590.1 hypothetical protein HCN44_004062 [Aphidius gifuensis]
MVLLTENYVEKQCAHIQSQKSLTKLIEKNHLQKITHLFMQDKFIDAIGNFSKCKNLRVIYMQNNCIKKIENLNFATNLTHLYLQHNNLSKIENLHTLKNLTHLFLGYNNISVIEGLENLDKLLELHVENQHLHAGESLVFDPRSLQTISVFLKVLNVAGNKLTSLRCFRNFINLETIDARNNLIDDDKDLSQTIMSLRWLKKLDLQKNPVAEFYRYRENVIANSNSLVCLDGKIISDLTRQFMKRFKQEKLMRLTHSEPKMSLQDDITSSLNLPPAFRRSVSRAILQEQPGPKLVMNISSIIGESRPHIFPAWKSTTAIAGMKNNHVTPRPFWRKKISKDKQLINGSLGIIDNKNYSSIVPRK